MAEFEEVFTREHFVDVLEALHTDQTDLRQALCEIERIANAWYWATESRGCYGWDDALFYSEFKNCLDSINDRITAALTSSNSAAHEICCGTYRHLRTGPTVAVQLRLDFKQRDLADQLAEIIKFSTIEGRINGN